MSFDSTTMRLMGGVPGQQLFLYQSADAKATVIASGYFNSAIGDYNMSTSDMILTVYGVGGTPGSQVLAVAVSAGVATTAVLA